MRKKLSEIITKEDRKELLEYLLNKEINNIRKKVNEKYSRRPAFFDDIEIKEDDLSNLNALGLYNHDENIYKHTITIDSKIITDYINRGYNRYKWKRKFDKRQLINTIGHELTHAFVQERFQYICNEIEDKNHDASPIFLATLQFLGYESNHECYYNYIGNEVWKDIVDIKKDGANYMRFSKYIISYIKEVDKIQKDFNKENELIKKNERYFINKKINFKFSARDSGLKKLCDYKLFMSTIYEKQLKRVEQQTVILEIGSMMTPQQIKKLINKKVNNDTKAEFYTKDIEKFSILNSKNYKLLYSKKEEYNKNKVA
ncbi:UNVERIFIED_ORG: hypothetical protein B2H93_14750 [Clostridium botulinum]